RSQAADEQRAGPRPGALEPAGPDQRCAEGLAPGGHSVQYGEGEAAGDVSGDSAGTGLGNADASSGWIATARAISPSARRGPGRVITTSSAGRIAPVLTAVIVPQPGRLATISGVVP